MKSYEYVWVLIAYNLWEDPNIWVYGNHDVAIKNYRYYKQKYSHIELQTHPVITESSLPDDWLGNDVD